MHLPLFKPEGKIKLFWEIYIFLLSLMVVILLPLLIVFRVQTFPSFFEFRILVPISFLADIVIQFNTGFKNYHEIVTDRRKVALRYIKTWLILDVIVLLPFLWIPAFENILVSSGGMDIIRIVAIVKIFGSVRTLGRIRKLIFFNPAITRLVLLVFWILIIAHLVACGWIYIGGTENAGSSSEMYTEAIYWTITTLTTIGYGDITPDGPLQMIYVTIVMLMGAAIYGFIVGNIANIIADIDKNKTRFRKKMEHVENFLKYREIPKKLQGQIHGYYDYIWESRRGYEESILLNDLPSPLRTQVTYFLNRKIIEQVPFFKNANSSLIHDIVFGLKPVVYTPGDEIITFGKIGHEMYFISKGQVDVTDKDGNITYATLGSGQFFGEIALLRSTPRTATVRARDYCDLYLLEKDVFNKALDKHPDFAKAMEDSVINMNSSSQTKSESNP